MENSSNNESSDDDNLYSNTCYTIEGRRYNQVGLAKLLSSKAPEDISKLKSIVTAIAEQDCHKSFYHLLAEGYRVGILNEKGQTALHLAFYNNANEILDWGNGYALYNCESGENYTDCHGLSHLHIASAVNNPEMVRRFLERKEDVNARYGDSQFTPLHLAVMHRSAEVIEVLLAHLANVNAKDATGRTPIHLAFGTSETYKRLMMSDGSFDEEYDFKLEVVIVKLLLERKCDLDVKDDEGNTPLFYVFPNEYFSREMWYQTERLSLKDELANEMSSSQAKKFELLLEYEVDVTTINNYGQNILHRIVSGLKSLRFPLVYSNISFEDDYYANMIKRLVSSNCKIDVNWKNDRGETPLQLAVSFMSSAVVKVLLEHGADLDSLKFNYDEEKICFDYPKIIPNLDAVRNVLDIVNLLTGKDFEITPKINMCILQFLVHDFEDCECSYGRDIDNVQHSVINNLQYGSWKHFASSTKKMIEDSTMPMRMQETYLVAREIEMKIKLCRVCLNLRDKEKFFEEVPRSLRHIDWGKLMEEVEKEVEMMRCTKLKDDVSLYDVMVQHPRRIFRYVVDGFGFDVEGFKHCGVLIKRRGALCLVRRYVENSADNYFKEFFSIPDVCCQNLLMYLNNENVLNVCLASKLNS